jgi:hypothetical protein
MVIEYTATPKDVAALYSYTRKHSLKGQLLFYGLPVGLTCFLLVESLAIGHRITLANWILALIFGLGLFFLFPLILRLRTKKDRRTLSIQPDKISSQIGRLSGDVPWVKVDSLYVTDEHIFIIGKNMNGFAIPRRAFVDDAQRQEFIRSCEQYIQHAKNN